MKIKTTARGMEVTESLERHIEKKLGKLAKFFDENITAQVKLSAEKTLQCVEVTIPLKDMILRSEEKTSDMYASVDGVVDKLIRQLRRHKTKLTKRLKEEFIPADDAADEAAAVETPEEDEVIRVKRFPVKPQDVDEALLQMQMLGHDFYVFSNAATGQVNVLYKRADGKYGLLEPDYE